MIIKRLIMFKTILCIFYSWAIEIERQDIVDVLENYNEE